MEPSERLYVVGSAGRRVFGPGPYELLRGVARRGSLAAAAQDMQMSYSKATRLLHDAERGIGAPLTERMVGGEGGGGSRLTPLGRDLCERYEAWISLSQARAEGLFETCFAGFGDVPRLGCVVMASGKACRYGSQKLLADLGGMPLLARTLRALPAGLVDTVVVTRSREVAQLCRGAGVEVALHDQPLQSDTVRAGLEVMGERPACLFVPGDQPLVSAESISALVRAACLNAGRVVRLSWQGRPGSPVIFPRAAFEGLRSLTGDEGGSALLRQRPDLSAQVLLVEATHAWELWDADTPDDLARMEEVVRRENL